MIHLPHYLNNMGCLPNISEGYGNPYSYDLRTNFGNGFGCGFGNGFGNDKITPNGNGKGYGYSSGYSNGNGKSNKFSNITLVSWDDGEDL